MSPSALRAILPGSWSLHFEGSPRPSWEIYRFTPDGHWNAKAGFQGGLLGSLYRKMACAPRGGEWTVRENGAEQAVLDLRQLRQDRVELIGSPADISALLLDPGPPGIHTEAGSLEFHCTLVEQDAITGYLSGADHRPERRATWSRIARRQSGRSCPAMTARTSRWWSVR